jgi:hypothetical protein
MAAEEILKWVSVLVTSLAIAAVIAYAREVYKQWLRKNHSHKEH